MSDIYTNIDITDLPTKGVYYPKNTFIKIRPLTNFEKNYEKSTNHTNQIDLIENLLMSLDSNIDSDDLCYTDACFIAYLIYGLTYEIIKVNVENEEISTSINKNDFLLTNPDFKNIEDLHYKELNLKFSHPSLYNVKKANVNIVEFFKENPEILVDKKLQEKFALVPYMTNLKINDDMIEFVNEHLQSITDEDIKKIRNFLTDNENIVLGQKLEYKNKTVLIHLNKLI